MKLDCTTDAYATLYERWLDNPGKLLDLAQMRPGARVIDLCGGTGIVAKEALKRGAKSAFVVDLNPARVYDDGSEDIRLVPSLWGRAEDVDKLIRQQRVDYHALMQGCTGSECGCRRFTADFDLVVCRQAIGYLEIHNAARAVANVLRPGGKFVFNTFKRPKFGVKRYARGPRQFIEASAYVGRVVFHVQALLWPFAIDVTKFTWHTEDDLDVALMPHFDVTKTSSETGLYYVAVKKPQP